MVLNDKIWFEDPNILFKKEYITTFWPTKYQTYNQRTNALSRLVIILGVLLSLYRKSTDVMVISIMILFMLYIMWNKNINSETKVLNDTSDNNINHRHYNPIGTKMMNNRCQKSTYNNPFANVLIGDKMDRPPACPTNELIVNDFKNKSEFDVFDNDPAHIQFYTTPNTTIPNDQHAFATWLYGNQKVCKSTQMACTGF